MRILDRPWLHANLVRAISSLSVLALVAALAFASSALDAAPAKADTQWFGSFLGKTYRTDEGSYPQGYIVGYGFVYGNCYGGIWGETYYGGVGSFSELWTDKLDLHNGSYQWVFEGWHYSSPPSTYVHRYNARCTRGSTNHWPNNSYVGTTSDGF